MKEMIAMAKEKNRVRLEMLRRISERGKTLRGNGKLLLPDSSGIF